MGINPEKYSQQFTSAEVAFLSHLADLTYSEGDLIYYHSGNLSRLPIGSTNQVLTVISGDPSWQTAGATSSPLTTKGDIYVYSSANTRLPVGTDGQILSADSSQTTGLKWITASGTGTVTSVASADGSITVTNATTTPDLAVVKAPKLSTARTINGTSFDGTANITVTAAAGTLTGTTLNATVVTSSLTSVGTITTGVWTGTTIAIANGGTGQTTKAAAFDALSPMSASGDIIYGGTSGTGTRLAKGSDGQVLTLASGLPVWQNASSGFTNPMTTLGDIIYEDATPTAARLAGNTTTTKKYLSQTGNGTISAVPAWAQIAAADIGSGAALTKTDDTNVTMTLGGTPSTALLVAASMTLGWTGQLGLTRGGTAASLTASNGGIVYSTGSALAILSGTATAGQILRSGASAAPTWSTATYPSTAGTSGNVLTSDGTNWISSAATGGSGAATVKSINQVAHGFAVGDVIRLSGTSTYAKAKADSVVNQEAIGMVSTVTDVDNFIVTTEGYVSGLSGLTANTVYFLDPSTAGAISATEPSTNGQVSKPLFISDTTSSGYFYNMRGMLLSATGAGTVTSVDMSVPAFLSISGNPITSSGTLAVTLSGTALPVANGGTGITSFGSGIATWLGTPSSANLAAAITDETGSGSLVFATSPTLVTPTLGVATATRLGIGAAADASLILYVTGNVTGGVATLERKNSNTTGNQGTMIVKATSTSTAAATFGSAFQFALGDSGTAQVLGANIAGTLSAGTLASNPSVDMSFSTMNSGVLNSAAITIKFDNRVNFTQGAYASGNDSHVVFTPGAHTAQTASTEEIDYNFAMNRTVQFATGALTNQRAFQIQAPTYGFVGASTITTAATFYISGAPAAGTNATITNAYSAFIDGNNTRIGGTAAGTKNSDVGGIGLELTGSNNTAGGMNLVFSNSNAGTSAFTSIFFQNDTSDSGGTKFANIGLNSSTYTDTTFGTAFGTASQFQIYSSVGSVLIGTTKASSFLQLVIGGSATTNEVARFTTTTLNLGLAGTITGKLALQGSTSGSVTIQGVAAGGSSVNTVQAVTDTFVYKATTDTLTNKRITRRAPAVTQAATPTINTDNTDVAHITGLAQAITSMTTNLSGTPVEGDMLRIDFTDNGTARAITWGTSFEASTVALPTTTVISTRLDVGFVWNTVTSKWRCVAVA